MAGKASSLAEQERHVCCACSASPGWPFTYDEASTLMTLWVFTSRSTPAMPASRRCSRSAVREKEGPRLTSLHFQHLRFILLCPSLK